jgi:hypothetical protein
MGQKEQGNIMRKPLSVKDRPVEGSFLEIVILPVFP